MSPVVDRLTQLRLHLDHLRELRPRVESPASLRQDLSLHNDVLFSLLTVCQLVIDIASELSTRRKQRFDDYTESIRSLEVYPEFPSSVLRELEKLPGFRNVLVHEYVALDFQRVINALDHLEPVEDFAEIVRRLETEV
ncbi:MAG TPA: HepT-like ribonuclease domain-containing protein [Thermoanaerobaculia bacterium]|nr:HepT-like ribonuclease domain-containing protein [Thermoanaerobaculia bacterium]